MMWDDEILTRTVFPLILGLALIGLITSGVQPVYLTTFGDIQAQIIQASYGSLLIYMAVKPKIHIVTHKVGAVLAMLIFVGKALGFAELVIAGGYHLIGPVGERLVLALAAFLWHRARIGKETIENGYSIG